MMPYISKEQSAKLDKIMPEKFNINTTMMMELAGDRLAEFTRMKCRKKKILVCVGKGNNGGDGLVAARHLLNFGYSVLIFLVDKSIDTIPLTIARKLKIPVFSSLQRLSKEISETDSIIDCLIGYNLKGKLRDNFRKVFEIINKSKKTVIACDVPSGIDADRGAIYNEHINAQYILFFGLPKKGCKKLNSEKYVADIGIPKQAYPIIKVKAENYFKDKPIIKI